MNYRNYAEITYTGDDNKYKAYFNNYYENDWYVIIDKQLLGEEIGREILDNENEMKKYKINKEEFKKENLNKIKEEITNQIANEINEFIFEHIESNE